MIQYRLNLPAEVKQRLWKILDDKVAEGPNLPYDCLERGCAQTIYVSLCEALKPLSLNTDKWGDKYKRTRREIVDQNAISYPWNRVFLYAVIGIEADRDVPYENKVIVPSDLLEVLQNSFVNGQKVIDSVGEELLPTQRKEESLFVSPMVVACLVVALSLLNILFMVPIINHMLVAFYSILGFFFTYIIFLSDFPGTGFNWLLIPFNLLPLIFWKWRARWALWFAGILLLWEVGMVVYPHRLTDPAYLVLVAAYILMYVQIGLAWRHGKEVAND